MARYVAFLRAINVGGRRVTMDALRQPFVALGYDNVLTFINSGNVIFTTNERAKPSVLEQRIETQVEAALGFHSEAFVRKLESLADIATHDAFPGQDTAPPATVYVAFLRKPASAAAIKRVDALRSAVDDFAFDGQMMYWLRRNSDSKFSGAALERALEQPTTVRNVSTVIKLVKAHIAS
jgi:uncharacterized protein (DUF1697 family)